LEISVGELCSTVNSHDTIFNTYNDLNSQLSSLQTYIDTMTKFSDVYSHIFSYDDSGNPTDQAEMSYKDWLEYLINHSRDDPFVKTFTYQTMNPETGEVTDIEKTYHQAIFDNVMLLEQHHRTVVANSASIYELRNEVYPLKEHGFVSEHFPHRNLEEHYIVWAEEYIGYIDTEESTGECTTKDHLDSLYQKSSENYIRSMKNESRISDMSWRIDDLESNMSESSSSGDPTSVTKSTLALEYEDVFDITIEEPVEKLSWQKYPVKSSAFIYKNATSGRTCACPIKLQLEDWNEYGISI
jgi:hypothetical protein